MITTRFISSACLSVLMISVGVRAQDKPAVEVDSTDSKLAKIVLIAGGTSHGPGEHEHFAGMALLMNMLKQTPGVFPVLVRDGWPKNEKVFEGARAVALYADGGGGNPFVRDDHLGKIEALANKGVGIGCIHYAVEVPKEHGGPEFLRWIGGYFEAWWSVNPCWTADFKELPKHPITRGVKPFQIMDEWYYHMRFAPDMKGVTPILSAIPTKDSLARPDGPHENNPTVRDEVTRGLLQHLCWAFERPDGARGFGFTGGHFHKNWGDENYRRVVTNALLWIAKVEVPKDGAKVDLAPATWKKISIISSSADDFRDGYALLA